MEKKYIKPIMKMVDVDTESLLASSPEVSNYNRRGNGSQLVKGKFFDDWDDEY